MKLTYSAGRIIYPIYLPVHIRILYLDSDYLVLYSCIKILADGSCDPDRRFLDILSRKPGTVDEDLREKFQFVIKRSCFEVGDLEQVKLRGDSCIIMWQERYFAD